MSNIQVLKKRNFKLIIISALLTALLSILTGPLFSYITGYNANEIHLTVAMIVWILNILVCYTLVFGFMKFFGAKYKYFNKVFLSTSYTSSVILVILISGSFEFLYITSYISAVAIIEIIHCLINLYKSKKRFY